MRVKGIIAEDFINYKLPSMFIVTTNCDFKCYFEQGLERTMCPNAHLLNSPTLDISDIDIYKMFAANDISKAVVIGGLEPFMQFDELENLVACFRNHEEDCDFVIYTGYYPHEIGDELRRLSQYKNIIVKFGRYIPDKPSSYDEVLGVTLASDNQFAMRIS